MAEGTAPAGNIITLVHGKSRLALHLLREGWGRPLLILGFFCDHLDRIIHVSGRTDSAERCAKIGCGSDKGAWSRA